MIIYKCCCCLFNIDLVLIIKSNTITHLHTHKKDSTPPPLENCELGVYLKGWKDIKPMYKFYYMISGSAEI